MVSRTCLESERTRKGAGGSIPCLAAGAKLSLLA
jgi:hypothetical protein